MRVNHQHLRAFHAVALEGSISGAARRLGVTQPTLSQQVRAFEQRHRVALFDGRRQPLQLTPTGQALFSMTKRLFVQSEEIELLLHAETAGNAGQVRLGSDSPVYAARLVAAFTRMHPGVGVHVRIGNALEVVRWLREGLLDAGIASDPQMDAFFAYQPVYRDCLAVALAMGHRLCREEMIAPTDLIEETLLLREPTSRTRQVTERLLQAADVKPHRTIEFHSREAIREAIALHIGVSLFYSAECPPDPRLCYRPLKAAAEAHAFVGYLICAAEQRRAPNLRALFAVADDLVQHSPLPV
jgi:DNA-binding transcriptional LysR family regulator